MPEFDLWRDTGWLAHGKPHGPFGLSVPGKYSMCHDGLLAGLSSEPGQPVETRHLMHISSMNHHLKIDYLLIHESHFFIRWPLQHLFMAAEIICSSLWQWFSSNQMNQPKDNFPTKASAGSVNHGLFIPDIPQKHPAPCLCRMELRLGQKVRPNPPVPGPYPLARILSLH